MSSDTNLNSVLQFSIKVAIGGAFVAVIFRYVYVDQDLFYYPVLGYLSVMTPTHGGFIQAGWSRVAATFLGVVTIALTLSSLGDSPLIAAFCYIATLLLCESLQWQGFLNATIVFPILFIDQVHGQYPWRYAYDRVIYNAVGVLMGTLVMLYLWPDKPRVTLSNYLTQILRDIDQEFQAIVVGHLRGELSSAESEQHFSQMQTLIQQGQSLLEDLFYGISGDWYVQDNWSELIAAQERLVRYLSQMEETFSSEGDNRLWHQNSPLLTDLVEQVSTVCMTLISLVPSRKANQSEIDIPLLSQNIAAIKEQIQQFRTSEDFMALPTSDILRFYAFLDALTSFTEELQQLGSRLHTRQVLDRRRHRIGLSFRLHSIPGDTVKKHLKAGLALGIVSALCKYFNFFGIKQSGLFFALMAMNLMQPVWGITIDTARIITISLAATCFSCYLLLETLGNNAAAIAVLLFVVTFFCSALKLNPIIFRLVPKIGATFLLLYSPSNPANYVGLWNSL